MKITRPVPKQSTISRRMLSTLAVLTCLAFLAGFLTSSNPSEAAIKTSQDVWLQTTKTDQVGVRVYYNTQSELDAVASELDIWENHREEGYIIAAVYPAQRDWLEASGYRVEIDEETTSQLQTPQAALDPRYYYFDDEYFNSYGRYVVDFLQDTQTAYPDLTELFDIGNAWQGDNGGYLRDMWVLRITNEDPAYGPIEEKPVFFIMAEIHAREVTTPELAVRYIKYLTSGYLDFGGYGFDPDVTWLVNHNRVYVLVMQNPDGYRINEANTDLYRRKNMDNNDGCTDPYSWGVDLNRNHSFLWGCCGGSSGSPCSETYRGPDRSSEPETDAFQDYLLTLVPDQNGPNGDDEVGETAPLTTTGIFVSLHSYADEILWPWYLPGYPNSPNQQQMENMGRKFSVIDPEYYPSGTVGYTVDGSANYWVYGKLGVPAYTFETGDNYGSCGDFFPAYGCQDGIDGMTRNFWAENRPLFIYMHKIANTPYMTAFGPDAQNLIVTPYSVLPGEPIDLHALITDDRYASDPVYPINAAEYFIDSPGEDGTGIAMLPSDGSWGENSEDVEALVDTTALAPGKHYLLIHGRNDQTQDVWGPFTAVFFEVVPLYAVDLAPSTLTGWADPGEAYTYTLQVTNLGQLTDTYTIFVDSLWDYTAPASLGPVGSQQSAEFELVVSVPLTATQGESDTAWVTVSGTGVSDNATITTTANTYAVEVNPASQEGESYPGSQVAYIFSVTNNGNNSDSFDVTASGVWTTTPETLVVGPLTAGESAELLVTVDVPLSALPGDMDMAEITLASQGNPVQTGTALITTTAVLLEGPVVSPYTSFAYGDPGQTVTHTLLVTNTADSSDTYDIQVNSAVWPTNAPATVGPLGPGETTSVEIGVSIPAGVPAEAGDYSLITFNSQLPGTMPASAVLATIANAVYGIEAEPVEASLAAEASGIPLTYTVTITNMGNTTDTYDLSVLSSSWGYTAPIAAGPLAAGESMEVTIIVYVPFEAHGGDSNQLDVTLISQGDPLKQYSVELTSTAGWYNLFMPFTTK